MSKMSIKPFTYPLSRLLLLRQTLSGNTMGTRYSAVFYAAPGTDVDALKCALFAALDRVDRQMSTWRVDSDLNKLNAAPVGTWMNVPPELADRAQLRCTSSASRMEPSTLMLVILSLRGASGRLKVQPTQAKRLTRANK
ncbi:MAG: FAD:protein FMN transferase [Hyphomicrobiaceae bacterium]